MSIYDMREVAIRELSGYNNFTAVKASAENTSLPEHSIDYITVAQAFHWFDHDTFKNECRRILKPGGKVVLVWNCKDETSEPIKALDAINKAYCPAYMGFSGGTTRDNPNEFASFFKDGICEFRIFQNDIPKDKEAFIGGCLSASYSPKEGTENYTLYINALYALFDKYNHGGTLYLSNKARSFKGIV